MENLKKYHEVGQIFIERLKLTTYPVAVRMIPPDEDVPEAALPPAVVFGSEVPACLVYTYCRRTGFSFFLTKDDIACKPIVLYFGLDELSDPDDLYRAWTEHAGYKCNLKAEKQSRISDARFEPFTFKGFVVSPLHQAVVKPDLVMIFSIPEDQFQLIADNLFLAGNKLQDPSPFSIPHPLPTMGANRLLGNPVEPPVWSTLREKLGHKEK